MVPHVSPREGRPASRTAVALAVGGAVYAAALAFASGQPSRVSGVSIFPHFCPRRSASWFSGVRSWARVSSPGARSAGLRRPSRALPPPSEGEGADRDSRSSLGRRASVLRAAAARRDPLDAPDADALPRRWHRLDRERGLGAVPELQRAALVGDLARLRRSAPRPRDPSRRLLASRAPGDLRPRGRGAPLAARPGDRHRRAGPDRGRIAPAHPRSEPALLRIHRELSPDERADPRLPAGRGAGGEGRAPRRLAGSGARARRRRAHRIAGAGPLVRLARGPRALRGSARPCSCSFLPSWLRGCSPGCASAWRTSSVRSGPWARRCGAGREPSGSPSGGSSLHGAGWISPISFSCSCRRRSSCSPPAPSRTPARASPRGGFSSWRPCSGAFATLVLVVPSSPAQDWDLLAIVLLPAALAVTAAGIPALERVSPRATAGILLIATAGLLGFVLVNADAAAGIRRFESLVGEDAALRPHERAYGNEKLATYWSDRADFGRAFTHARRAVDAEPSNPRYWVKAGAPSSRWIATRRRCRTSRRRCAGSPDAGTPATISDLPREGGSVSRGGRRVPHRRRGRRGPARLPPQPRAHALRGGEARLGAARLERGAPALGRVLIAHGALDGATFRDRGER